MLWVVGNGVFCDLGIVGYEGSLLEEVRRKFVGRGAKEVCWERCEGSALLGSLLSALLGEVCWRAYLGSLLRESLRELFSGGDLREALWECSLWICFGISF